MTSLYLVRVSHKEWVVRATSEDQAKAEVNRWARFVDATLATDPSRMQVQRINEDGPQGVVVTNA